MIGRRHVRILTLGSLFALLAACGQTGSSGDRSAAAATDASVVGVQATLVNDTTKNAARELVAVVERPLRERTGAVAGEIDLSRGTIDYYAADTSAVEASPVLDLGDAELEIVDWGPQGLLPAENARPRVYVMFSQPMVPVARLGAEIDAGPIMTVEPAVDGTYRWYGTRTLSFEPAASLFDHPAYTVTVHGGVTSLGDNALPADFTFEMFSQRLEVVNSYAGTPEEPFPGRYDVPPSVARTLVLEFNQPVDLSSIEQGLSVSWNDTPQVFSLGRPTYPPELASRTDRAALVVLDQPPPERTRVVVTLKRGVRPAEGYPQTASEQTLSVDTLAAFGAERLTSYRGSFPMDNRPFSYPVFLDFSHPLAEDAAEAAYVVRLDGEKVEPEGVDRSYADIRFFVPGARPGQTVTVDVPAGVTDAYGRTLGAPTTLTYTIPRPDPRIDFPSQRSGLRHLEAEFDPAIVFTTRNLVGFSLGLRGGDTFFGVNRTVAKSPYELAGDQPDYVYFNRVDLGEYLNESGHGTVFLDWSAQKDPSLVRRGRDTVESDQVAVQVTDLGITTRYAFNRALVWVNRLSDGSSVAGASVEVFNLRGARYTATTDDTGLAAVRIPDGAYAANFDTDWRSDADDVHVRVRYEGDIAEMLVNSTQNPYRFGVRSTERPNRVLQPQDRVHLFTDRGMYQPGEELAFRGIHWLQTARGFSPAESPYSVVITDATDGQEVWRSAGQLSASGGFFGRLELPEGLDSGDYSLEYRSTRTSSSRETVRFHVGSLRRVAFEVTSIPSDRVSIVGEPVSVSIAASYLAGGTLSGASYQYHWTRTPVRYVPPGPQWEDWTVGTSEWGRTATVARGDGSLSAAGTAGLEVGTSGQELPGKPYRYTVEARVEDVDRQVVAHTTSRVVHPADHYVAARFVQGSSSGWWSRFVPTDSEIVARARLVSIDGDAITTDAITTDGTIHYGLAKGEWREAPQQGIYGGLNTRWEYVEETLYEEDAPLTDGTFDYRFSVSDPGRYTLFFVSTDAAGRATRTEIPFYATGSGWVATASQTPEDIDLVVDKSVYEPGETARILVQSPIPEGRYLLTVEREGLMDQRVVELSGSTEIIEVPVRDDYVPVFYVALSSFTSRTETEDDYYEPDLGKPRGLFGITSVNVATTAVELDVQVTPSREAYGPGDDADVLVEVTHNGEPVADAEVTILAVDRGVLDLNDYHVPNPLEFFYNPRNFPLGVRGDDSRRLLLRPLTYDISTLQGGDAAKLEEREDFNPLALFEPAVRTDADGRARVQFSLPDSLTTYRMTAVALHGYRLGLEEREFMVQNPINVRTALPRRFRVRDTAAAGVILTNTTDTDQVVEVSAESDILTVADEATKEIVVPAGGAFELPFVLEAHRAGRGAIRFTSRGDEIAEVLESRVIVDAPIVSEAFTSTGTIAADGDGVTSDNEAPSGERPSGAGGATTVEGVEIPSAVAPANGSLSVSLATSLRPLIDPAVDALTIGEDAPYSDIRRLYDLSVRVQGYAPLDAASGLLAAIAQNQFDGGGIGFRPQTIEYARPNLFLSLVVAQVLEQAREHDVELRHNLNAAALRRYLRGEIDTALNEERVDYRHGWAAALLAGDGEAGERAIDGTAIDANTLNALASVTDRLGVAGTALLAEAYLLAGDEDASREVYQEAKNLIVIGTQSVDFRERYEARGYFDSGEAELALLLRIATLLGEPDDLLTRIAASLNRDRNQRRFHSNHDDFWTVHGFAPILARETSGGATAATVRLGDTQLFQVDTTEPVMRELAFSEEPLAGVPRDEVLPLAIDPGERSPMYYTTILRYALPAETTLPRDEGIEVRTQIETLDGEVVDENVLPLGETLRMRVFLSTTSRRSFLSLRVPLPSGAEILDPNLSTTGSYGDVGGLQSEEWTRESVYGDTQRFSGDGYAGRSRDGWWFWFYRPIQRIYDNAILYTWEDFYAGSRDVSFLFRTTTPGVYPTPPSEAFLEFEPEVFGRGAGRLIVIPSE